MKRSLLLVLAVVAFLILFSVSTVALSPVDSPLPGQEPPTPGDDDALQSGLLWLFGGGGAGILAYAALGKIKAFENLSPEYKRYVSLGATALFAVGAFLVASQLNYVEAPTTAQGWLEKLSAIAYASTATALVLHGVRQLRADGARQLRAS